MLAGYIIGCVVVSVVAFLLGSIPFGVLIGKLAFKADPRDGGSGSIGATNMGRQFGWKAAAGTFVGDVAKGALAVAFARVLAMFIEFEFAWQFELLLCLAVLFSILGHIFCPWLNFHGGKGISTGLGSLLVAYPLVVTCMLLTFIVVLLISRRVSAGSIAAAVSCPIFAFIFCGLNIPLLVIGTMIAIFVVFAHRGNIKRMINGTEPKISMSKLNGEKAAQTDTGETKDSGGE